jgi:hypothetical protein
MMRAVLFSAQVESIAGDTSGDWATWCERNIPLGDALYGTT